MTWPYYLIALWPLIGIITVIALCRAIHKSKPVEAGSYGVFVA